MKTREEVRNELMMELMDADRAFRTIRNHNCPLEAEVRETTEELVQHISGLQRQLAVVSGELR